MKSSGNYLMELVLGKLIQNETMSRCLLFFLLYINCFRNNREVSYEELKEKLKTAEKLLEQTENNVRQNPPGENY